tara:strand:- start:44 stop:739 length:696 start_codon:yes stop_codon:yes gene_type:complete
MSEIRVTSVVGENGGDRVGLTTGLTVGPLTGTTGIGATISHQGHAQFAGVCTATSFSGSGANLTGLIAGITMIDQYYLTATKTGNANQELYLNADFIRVSGNVTGAGHIGTGMTKSSEIFSFPSTGIYLINFRTNVAQDSGSSANRYAENKIYVTTNNSSYTTVSMGLDGIVSDSGERFGHPTAEFVFDVTNTSTHKCKFSVQSGGNAWKIYSVGTGRMDTVVTFTRLGDT